MKIRALACCSIFAAIVILFAPFLSGQEEEETTTTGTPPDPFAGIELEKTAKDYPRKVDRSRGIFSLTADKGKYVPGDHFAHWHWTAKPSRWGNYFVAIEYTSNRTKLGVQVRVGDLAPLKSYAPRTSQSEVNSMVIGTVYIPEEQEYPVVLLTGDQSNVPDFMVKGLKFIPAPESETLGQSIDGGIDLLAKSATTFSVKMRYEPDEKKDCLGFWTHEEDWAEWKFDVSTPGRFAVNVVQGCGTGNGGSEVEVLIDGESLLFKVEDTGGFQNWKTISLGNVHLDVAGEHKLAVIPRSKTGKAVMDIQKIVLTPLGGEAEASAASAE